MPLPPARFNEDHSGVPSLKPGSVEAAKYQMLSFWCGRLPSLHFRTLHQSKPSITSCFILIEAAILASFDSDFGSIPVTSLGDGASEDDG
jgi:hypothetical protein